MNAIDIINLTKSYNSSEKALNNISFSIPRGEIFGFLGPNGSGKTTTVRILNGILSPTSGNIKILDKEVKNNIVDIHKVCGVMTETAACYEGLSAEENLMFFGSMHEIEERELRKRCEALLKDLELYEAKDKKVGNYSTGMRKRVSLAISLIHNPKVLFLDEPTSGLDPENAVNVTKLIKKLAKEKEVTVFLCTHQLKYAEDICTLYGFINKGNMLGFGTFQELIQGKGIGTYLKLRGKDIPLDLGFEKIGQGEFKKIIKTDNEVSDIIYNVLNRGGKVYEASQINCDLEELYFAYMRGDKNE